MLKLKLFGTLGCHLCEDASKIIANCEPGLFEIESIDIADHDQWQEKYALRIPVLYHPVTNKDLSWPFEQDQVQLFIEELLDD